ncbi:mandelate racemase/muconate lactonizing enzyme family protein [Streptomyces sp. TS71-3]|uniref:mandelate racemase/muconate lactonizing enzyme family protein n=1 Tax=Streptomyces sp. TS71-3 TaxID=2733862 RepID=UPI001AFCF6D3|nr:mandelate racemase/muconate lactonizing enzyme family protein [Streptomyces sp. TS71-3]GHJ36720.1 mandelate racemase [Streptomyces sp. TS71-3]
MKITKVESIVLLDRYHLVRVHTDEGVDGVGEVSPMNTAVTHTLVEQALAPLIVGENPADIERLWMRMYTHPYKLGPMGAQLNAIAGIDIALWDIAGKVAGQPLHALLGGTYRAAPEVYASSMQRGMAPAEEAARAVSFQEQGYRAYKIHSATPWMADDGFDQTLDTVREMRAAVGDDFDILVDVNNAYYPHTAVRIARRLEEYGVFHFEEPLAPHDHDGYAALAAAVDIPIAAGEQEYTRWQFRDLILHAKLDILQPDVIKCGGITEFRRIAALASTFNKPITVHNTQPTIGTLAHLHLWMSTPACVYAQEYNIEPHPLRDEIPVWREPVLPQGGRMRPPAAPGLGVELDEEAVRRLRSA